MEVLKMERLKRNQLLVTISEDKKSITVENSFGDKVIVASCPNKPLDNIGNAVQVLEKKYQFTEYNTEWKSAGCGYDATGTCIDCN